MKKANIFISLCLVLVVSSVLAYLYIGPRGSGGSDDLTERVEDLESRLSELESRLSELERLENLESRLSEQLVLSSLNLDMNEQTITFYIMHIGTANVTISEIRVNNVLNSSSPGWEGLKCLAPGMAGGITLYGLKYFADGFTGENYYPITVTTTRGNTFYLYPLTFTFVETEQLTITGVTFQTGNATISLQNMGASALSISSVTVDNVTKTILATGGNLTGSGPYDLAAGASGTITISLSWASGVKYTFAVITTKDNQFIYTTKAP